MDTRFSAEEMSLTFTSVQNPYINPIVHMIMTKCCSVLVSEKI